MNMAIKVKNIKGTGSNARQITGTWLEFWEEQKGYSAEQQCYAFDEDPNKDKTKVYRCKCKDNLVGGHVKKIGSNDNRWYILPICSSHNKLDKEFYAREEDLVLATK
jgi:hypothetical protein